MVEHEVEVSVPTNGDRMAGTLTVPDGAQALVVFAHGSGSSRFSPRNRFVAQRLREGSLGTLLLDLLTPREERADISTAQFRFDIDLLAQRVVAVTDWIAAHETLRALHIGYFGASTGAAAALIAAARRPGVGAVVSRGGRPDLAGHYLPDVTAPTLLIVGGHDFGVIELNQDALGALGSRRKELRLVAGATHLFEEPGALEQVAALARQWFEQYLVAPRETYAQPPG